MATNSPPSGLPTITATAPNPSGSFDYTTLGYDPGTIDSMVREEMQGGEGVVSYGETYRDVVVDALVRLGVPFDVAMGLPQEEINKLYDQLTNPSQTELDALVNKIIFEDTLRILEEGDQPTALSDQQRVAALEQVQSGLGQINLEDGLDAGETEYLYQVLNQRIFSPEDIASTLGIPVEDVIGGFNTMATERQGSLLPVTQASTTPNVSTTPATPTAEPSIWGSIQQSVNRVGREIGRGMDMVFDALGIPKPDFSVIQPNMPGGTVIWGQPQGGSVFGQIGTTPGKTVVGVQTGIPILDILIGKAADVISGRVSAGDVTFTPEDVKQVLEDTAEQVLVDQGIMEGGDLGDLVSIAGDLKDIGTQVLTRSYTTEDEYNSALGVDLMGPPEKEEDKTTAGVPDQTDTQEEPSGRGVKSPAYDPYTDAGVGGDQGGGSSEVAGVTSPAYDPYSPVGGGDQGGGSSEVVGTPPEGTSPEGTPPEGTPPDGTPPDVPVTDPEVTFDPYTDAESPTTDDPEVVSEPPEVPPDTPTSSGGGFFGLGFGSTPGKKVTAPILADTYSYDPYSSQIIQGPRADVYGGAGAVTPAIGPGAREDVVDALEQGSMQGLEGQDLFEYLINMLKGEEEEKPQDIFKTGFAAGGPINTRGLYLGGPTDGMADKIPANINNVEPVKLSDGEFVIPADVVSHLGNGNSDAGAEVLYDMLERVRTARTGSPEQGRQINPYKYVPGLGRNR